jgi:heme exporter protein D
MNWNSWSEFFAMGGYAGYVWSSVLVTFALLGLEIFQILRARKMALRWVKSNLDVSLSK